MEWWVLILIVIFGGSSIWGILDSVLSHRRKMAKIRCGQSEREAELTNENSELVHTIADLKKRLAVLETIATDPARRTADEIERLR